ncbi:MAG: OmpA family protein, partial [Flavobacteriales bacterium]|nr:OmpA family protein [Flavobacteriales bacterium]
RPASTAELNRLIKLMNDVPTLKIELGGHTDSQGATAYNQSLSERRAKAVVDYLTKAGISGARLVSAGYGEDEPIATNETKAGRQLNRRTEFKVLAL